MTQRLAVLLRFGRGMALLLETVSYWLFPNSVIESPPSGSLFLVELLYFMWAVALLQLLGDILVVCKHCVHRLSEYVPYAVGALRDYFYPNKPSVVYLCMKE